MDKPARKQLSQSAIPAALKKLKRRSAELEQFNNLPADIDWYGSSQRIARDINATIDEVFGIGTADAQDFHVDSMHFLNGYAKSDDQRLAAFQRGLRRAKDTVEAAVKRLNEWAEDAEEDDKERVLQAYEGMNLHPEIGRAASQLYRDRHYAHAVEDAVKALNDLVRLRSGESLDGTSLMEFVFSPKDPILAFNELNDDQDRNEQKGFMMMFSGAVAGLRNPRAHRIVQDDPERALEFIAYVSLLAKLLDGAMKRSKKGP